jgi:hypothetical protein
MKKHSEVDSKHVKLREQSRKLTVLVRPNVELSDSISSVNPFFIRRFKRTKSLLAFQAAGRLVHLSTEDFNDAVAL